MNINLMEIKMKIEGMLIKPVSKTASEMHDKALLALDTERSAMIITGVITLSAIIMSFFFNIFLPILLISLFATMLITRYYGEKRASACAESIAFMDGALAEKKEQFLKRIKKELAEEINESEVDCENCPKKDICPDEVKKAKMEMNKAVDEMVKSEPKKSKKTVSKK